MNNLIDRRDALKIFFGTLIAPYLMNVAEAGTKQKRTLKVGRLELEVVQPEDAGIPQEYMDPNKTRSKLVYVPEERLSEKVSDSFTLGEFAIIRNPGYNKGKLIPVSHINKNTYHRFIRMDPKIVDDMQKLRDTFGSSLTVICPFRNLTYNAKCGGELDSRHKSGQAVDITPSNGKGLKELYRLADEQFANGGLGYYPRQKFIHVDVRGFRARWTR